MRPRFGPPRANTLAQFRGWSPFVGLQVEYSLMERTPERELMSMAQALNIGCTAWSPLAGGVLTGKYHGHGSSEEGRMSTAVLHNMKLTAGANSTAGLLQATDGNSYGVDSAGGANSDGTIFSISPTKPYLYKDLHDFNGTMGATPWSPLLMRRQHTRVGHVRERKRARE